MNYHNSRRSPAGFRSAGGGGHQRAFESPPHRSPGRGGGFRPIGGGDGFRPMGGEGPGEYGFNSHQAPPLSGQKRGFPFSGRGGSPDRFDGGNFAKLFVGSVPRTATEEDIRPLFEEHGNVIEVALIKDKKTGQHQEGGKTCKPVSCSLYSRWDLGRPKDPAHAIVAAAVGALPND